MMKNRSILCKRWF